LTLYSKLNKWLLNWKWKNIKEIRHGFSNLEIYLYESKFKYLFIVETNLDLRGYSGENIIPVKLIHVKVELNQNN